MDDITRIMDEGTAREQVGAGLVEADASAIHQACAGGGCDGCQRGWNRA